MTGARLNLTRRQVLAFRRQAGALGERLPAGRDSLRRAAWAGLQDSMPRAALLSLHARVEGTCPSSRSGRCPRTPGGSAGPRISPPACTPSLTARG
jgi:hypothetical protein